MSIHVYYLNPDFSCKQLLAAIILSNRLLYSGHGDKLFMFSDSFSIVKILLRLSPIPFPFLQMLQFIVVANIKKFLAIQTLLLPLLLFSTSMIDLPTFLHSGHIKIGYFKHEFSILHYGNLNRINRPHQAGFFILG